MGLVPTVCSRDSSRAAPASDGFVAGTTRVVCRSVVPVSPPARVAPRAIPTENARTAATIVTIGVRRVGCVRVSLRTLMLCLLLHGPVVPVLCRRRYGRGQAGVRAGPHRPGVTSVTRSRAWDNPSAMSDHAERLRKLAERVTAARGFL